MPEVQFQPGSKALLVSLLDSIKDFLPQNAANLIFTPRGLALRFASGRNTDSRVVVACHLDAEANHRPFTFTRNTTATPNSVRRRSSVGANQLNRVMEHDDGKSDAGESVMSVPEGKFDKEKMASQQAAVAGGSKDQMGMYGIIGKYTCNREAVLIGFSPQLMIDQLQLVDENDNITIRAEEAEDGSVQIYEMYIESRDLTRKCLYEVDAIPLIDRFAPLPDIQYNVVCQIETKEFNRIVDALHGTSDKIIIMANKNSITFCATGNDGTLQVGLVQKPGVDKPPVRFKVLSYSSGVKHVVDSRLLKGFAKASPLSQNVLLFLPATPSQSRPAAPIRVTYEITVFELPDGTVILSSEFDPKKHLPPPPSPVQKPQLSGNGWRNNGSNEIGGWNKDSKRSSMITAENMKRSNSISEPKRISISISESKRNSISVDSPAPPSTAGTPSEGKTFASIVSKDKDSTTTATTTTTTAITGTSPSSSGFLGIGAPRSSTPVGVHSNGTGMGVSVTEDLGSVVEEQPSVQVRVVGQLHYLLAGELGPV